jgi:hypothetical protein
MSTVEVPRSIPIFLPNTRPKDCAPSPPSPRDGEEFYSYVRVPALASESVTMLSILAPTEASLPAMSS